MGVMHSGVSRNHPVRQVLDIAATGHAPTRADLDEVERIVEDPAHGRQLRRTVHAAAERIAEIRHSGHNQAARNLAAEITAELVAPLPEYKPPERELPNDPRALADAVHGASPEADELRESIKNIQRF